MNQKTLKEFVELYLNVNKIKYSVKNNEIYEVNFETILANKLGKLRKFSFSRKIHDDYGVEYASLNNDMIKYFIRDSTKNGQILKTKLKIPLKANSISFYNGIEIESQKELKSKGICFLFKISTTSPLENKPEFLRYVILDYETFEIFPEEIIEEFHNFDFIENNFKFDSSNANHAHTIAYEHMHEMLTEKYSEHENTNISVYEERKKELIERHENFKKECRIEEDKIKNKIDELNHRILAARSYEAEKKYRNLIEFQKKKIIELEKKNKIKIDENYLRTNKRIEDENSKYNFKVELQLLSALIFEYDTLSIRLIAKKSHNMAEIYYNQITNSVQKYICPSCGQKSMKPILSYSGHICCEKCAVYSDNLKSHLCKKDDVENCTISGDYVIKRKSNQCECCKKYYQDKYIKKDVYNKNTCPMCLVKLYNGEEINKKDAIFLKEYNANFKKEDLVISEFSKKQFPKSDTTKTTGSNKVLGKTEIRTCKSTKLTFAPNEMASKFISKLAENLKEIACLDIKYTEIKSFSKTKFIEYNENKYWILFRPKKMFSKKYYLFNKRNKSIKEL